MKSRSMSILLRLEELGFFLITIYLFTLLPYPWWVYPLLLFIPDISILGYMINSVTGAYLYNFIHHRGIALILYVCGVLMARPMIAVVGLMLFAHSSLDRVFGYGLKHKEGFNQTHLGEIGSKEKNSQRKNRPKG
ncbi:MULTISPECIES: DUF4260 domain-containing protein [unclassified Oceanispirochaeta]|uniref:DUF4260 domain-containing protein n=1 Tax=unclassified Oceanispirochaeta TaxID=2635722 RepID=UPI0018F30E7E|nr:MULTISPECIES: DUF4260 domain-containing protein [unclassified Oceanispirochaeta]